MFLFFIHFSSFRNWFEKTPVVFRLCTYIDRQGAFTPRAFWRREPDDDLNDVAAMGGVNIAEESQRILEATAAGELLARESRSLGTAGRCPSAFVDAHRLGAQLRLLGRAHGLRLDPVSDPTALVALAVEQRLRHMLERLAVLAEHRTESMRVSQNAFCFR